MHVWHDEYLPSDPGNSAGQSVVPSVSVHASDTLTLCCSAIGWWCGADVMEFPVDVRRPLQGHELRNAAMMMEESGDPAVVTGFARRGRCGQRQSGHWNSVVKRSSARTAAPPKARTRGAHVHRTLTTTVVRYALRHFTGSVRWPRLDLDRARCDVCDSKVSC